MSVILILILASLTLALAFLAGFIWAVRSGQYEDTFTPSLRVLTEEENPPGAPASVPAGPNRAKTPARMPALPVTATSSSDQINRQNIL